MGAERQAIHHATGRSSSVLRLLQAINNVRYVRSFNALKVKEVAVACSAVESVCGRVVLEILADHGGNLMHNCNKGRDGLCVRVVLLCNILGSRSDGCVDCDVQKTLATGAAWP